MLELSSSVSDYGIYNLQGAVTAVENKTHKVVAIIGSRTQEGMESSNYNRAFQYVHDGSGGSRPVPGTESRTGL